MEATGEVKSVNVWSDEPEAGPGEVEWGARLASGCRMLRS